MWIGPGPGQGQPPRICNRLRDNAEARTKQYPSADNLGSRRAALKMLRERLDAGGELLDRAGQRKIRIRRKGRAQAGAQILHFVSEQQSGKKQLARLVDTADGRAGAQGLFVHEPGEAAELVLLAIAAGHVIAAPAHLDRHFRHLPPIIPA